MVDGLGDNGIDAIYCHAPLHRLTVVQSKFVGPDAGLGTSDVAPFIQGIKDLLDNKRDRFASHIQAQWPEIEKIVNDFDIQVQCVLISTSGQGLSAPQQNLIDDLVRDKGDFLTFETIGFENVKDLIRDHKAPTPISLDEVLVNNCGHCTAPVEVVYGLVDACEVAQWFDRFGTRLFDRNIRSFKKDSEVNDGITQSVIDTPEHFWVFNNGVTLVCKGIKRRRAGGGPGEAGVFSFSDVSVVNGAQTVGSIARAFRSSPTSVKSARVSIRFVSTEGEDDNFEIKLTKTTNTQNRVEARDFVSLDPLHDELARQFRLLEIDYLFRSGDTASNPEKAVTLDDATVALACAQGDLSLAVLAKSGIGKLWADTTKAPYTTVFPRTLTASHVQGVVEDLRRVDECLKQLQPSLDKGTKRLTSIHGNRIALHLYFRLSKRPKWKGKSVDVLVKKIVAEMVKVVLKDYSANYPASIFKSPEKCKHIVAEVMRRLG